MDNSISMVPEWDRHLHVLRDTDKDFSLTSPPIGGIPYLNLSHPRGLFHILYLISYLCSLV